MAKFKTITSLIVLCSQAGHLPVLVNLLLSSQEKWSLAQEKNRLSSLQTSLERERASIQEQQQRERQELQRARDSLLEEQRSILGQLHDERRLLSEERAQFHINQKLKQDKEQRDTLYQVKV